MNQCMFKVAVTAVVVVLASVNALAQVGAVADVCRPPTVPFVTTEAIPAEDLAGVFGAFEGITGTRLTTPNLRAAAFLSRLDIDGDGIPDNAPDTDGDGLPDNWEIGGFEALTAAREVVDRVVFFPAPTAVVPGTPPTPIFSRRPVATSALNPDTDGDGLTDFVEVFGLMFIDEDRDGILTATEWSDKNGDAIPSPGEFPIDNSGGRISRPPGGPDDQSLNLLHDYDGFIFTDPTNFDTDGDSCADGDDVDPLINPRAFGTAGALIVRFSDQEKPDIDRDGLGNGMDLGNDLVAADADAGSQTFQVIDNPQNIRDLLNTFRSDLLPGGVVPEAEIEDLLGADWDGSGLWRTTDALGWRIVHDPDDPNNPTEFSLPDGTHSFMASQTFEEFSEAIDVDNPYDERLRGGEGTGIGLGWQELLRPSGPSGATEFIPDPTVWAILYSWRVPGFDIDGDGFVGVPAFSNIAVEQRDLFAEAADGSQTPHTDEIVLVSEALSDIENPEAELDGILDAPEGFPTFPMPCGNMGAFLFLMLGIGFVVPRVMRR